ncbi:ABC transporter ATP-binding protein [Actinotalea subterranea]|uniref:ABC transporter ATP-binding protein n=1 Tax=Actinotalea subterranea TaxID=2607497 RepID=UPI001CAA879E|nr:ABC transporter ATP-binding protein [Actinotalea subterranea]
MTTENALAVQGLTKSFGGFALRDVTLTLPTGYVMGFVGPNGAGKTTTIKCLLGMLRIDGGTVEVLGRRVDAGAPGPADDVGVVLDRPYYVSDWRLDDVESALRPFYSRWDGDRWSSLLDRFELDRRRKVKDLSRGMGMKLMVAAALSHDARLLVLDEPTSGLDPAARDELLTILSEFLEDEQHSVLFSTHITTDLERIADYVTFIRDGAIVSTGTKDDLLDAYRVVRGGPQDAPPPGTPGFVSTRRHGSGFEALARAEAVRDLPDGVVVEPASLDDIVIHVGRASDGAFDHAEGSL